MTLARLLCAFTLLASTIAIAAPAPSKPAPTPAEDCVVIDPLAVKTDHVGSDWRVTLAPNAFLDYGVDQTAAARAVEVIQHYHFTRQCFVKRPAASMMYWRNGVAVPPGNLPGQDCITLHPESITVIYADARWKVMDGGLWLLDFHADRDSAEEAAHIIRTYSLNRECFIARPHVAMQYWLTE